MAAWLRVQVCVQARLELSMAQREQLLQAHQDQAQQQAALAQRQAELQAQLQVQLQAASSVAGMLVPEARGLAPMPAAGVQEVRSSIERVSGRHASLWPSRQQAQPSDAEHGRTAAAMTHVTFCKAAVLPIWGAGACRRSRRVLR